MKGFKQKIRNNRFLKWGLVLSNWLLQGILHADRTEMIYKILFTLFMWSLMTIILINTDSRLSIALTLGFIIGHSINWIVNGNISSLLIHRLRLVKLSKRKLFAYLQLLEQRTIHQSWVQYAAAFGSICHGKLNESSDLDVSIVRKPGFRNAILGIWFVLKEKKHADMMGIPLEIYISDSPENSIKRFGKENNPVVVSDPENSIDLYYERKLTISGARKLNTSDEA